MALYAGIISLRRTREVLGYTTEQIAEMEAADRAAQSNDSPEEN